MIQFLKTYPDLLPRMLVHLPYISPIYDILNKLVTTDDIHPQLGIISWLHESQFVPQVLDLLDPVKSAVAAHTPAGDLLRGIVAASSAASASKQQQQQQAQAKFGEADSTDQENTSVWSNWPNNSLVRELASQRSVKRLLGYMLDSDTAYKRTASREADADAVIRAVRTESSTLTEDRDDLVTPTISPEGSRDLQIQSSKKPNPEAITSSLLNSLTLIIDIIRQNTSDFPELQILQDLERAHGGFDPEAMDDEGGDMAGEGEEDVGRLGVMDQGPSLVDLEPMLRELTARLPDLHQLLRNPRSNVGAFQHQCPFLTDRIARSIRHHRLSKELQVRNH